MKLLRLVTVVAFGLASQIACAQQPTPAAPPTGIQPEAPPTPRNWPGNANAGTAL
ncbi:MAG TPA: hypothetical protein VF630_15760 [Hymenobacter sp.]